MTTTESSPPAVQLFESRPDEGCSTCGSQDTVQLHPFTGRECPDHITLPPGGYRPDLADDMVACGRADAAFTYLGAYLARAADTRFQLVAARLGGAQ